MTRKDFLKHIDSGPTLFTNKEYGSVFVGYKDGDTYKRVLVKEVEANLAIGFPDEAGTIYTISPSFVNPEDVELYIKGKLI